MTAARRMNDMPTEGFNSGTTTNGGVIYGPFANGPMGSNLGVNILGTGPKVCSFNCPYCDLGATELRLNRLKTDIPLPTLQEIDQSVREAFQKIHASGPAVEGICLSGNGEPTLHPDFPDVVKRLIEARNLWMPGKKISLFTNGASLDRRKIAEAANLLDERLVKIDAGGEKLFKLVNAPLSRTNLARVIAGTRKLKDVIVQSMFFQGTITNTSPTDLDEWIEVIAMVKPKSVHLFGLSRSPAQAGLVRCDEDTLYGIASRLERKTQIKAVVTP